MLRAVCLSLLSGLLLVAALAGCDTEDIPYREVKRTEDRLSTQDLQTFLEIIDTLPDKKLPPLPQVFIPPPRWNPSRTLPVNELVAEETKLVNDRTRPQWVADRIELGRQLKRTLAREGITPEQFAALTISIGMSLARTEIPKTFDLEGALTTARRNVSQLRKDTRVFSTLSDDAVYQIIDQSAWITLAEQAHFLRLIPPENVALVRPYRERLTAIFPEEFSTNPLTVFAKILEDRGTPFEEIPESGTDDRISWSRANAIVGNKAVPTLSPQAPSLPSLP